ncbi:hypothetical protein ACLQ3C_00405 [Gordonia sp. DT30]|uniref:hypothetical protein n=1 Tax=unclassified Gordonia (in: high G+C Gram-positive bacteria) TaxID=2657482 RepID=UPI003CF62976
MAHHRVNDDKNKLRHRGVSRGLVLALLAVVLVAACVVVWFRVGDHVNREADQAAATCVKGPATVTILADPDITPGLTAVAAAYSDTHPVVRDHCVRIAVAARDAKVTLDGLTGNWDTASMGAYPAAWVPQSSVWAAELTTAKPDLVDGDPDSLVTSPVVLATAPELGTKLSGRLDWGQLPTLQRRDDSLGDFGLQGWGSLRMAMPREGQSDPTALAAQAVAMRVTRSMGTLTADDAASPRVASSIDALTESAPRSPDGSPAGAAGAIADASDPATAAIHAVPITEQRLYQLTKNDARARLAEVMPSGPTPIADFPVVHLKGDQVPEFAGAAVAEFLTFAGKPEHLRALTVLGFRGDAPLPAKTATVTFPVTDDPMPNPENQAIVTINKLIYGPSAG